jgi:hypothetical protein
VALGAALACSFAAVHQAGMAPTPVFVAMLALVAGAQLVGHPAVLGHRVAKLPTTGIAIGLVIAAVWGTAQFGLLGGAVLWSAALFALCLDWNTLARLPLPLLLSLLLVTVALTRGQADGVTPLVVAWAVAAIATLGLMEHDLHDASPQLLFEGPAPVRAKRRGVGELLVIAAVLLVVVPLLAALVPNISAGRASRLGDLLGRDEQQSTPYWGFDDQLDTSRRGELSDEVVMRVQAEAPDYWRGATYDEWDGRVWKRSTTGARTRSRTGHLRLAPALGDAPTGAGQPFTQVVTIEREGSDLVFGAYRPAEADVAVPVSVDRVDGAIRAAAPLPAGSLYTIVSQRPNATAASLRADDPARAPLPDAIAEPYLQLPATPERVRALAREITAGAPTTYDKVQTLQRWMIDHTEYTLDIPPLPEGADAVEQHLFVDKKGFCEQICARWGSRRGWRWAMSPATAIFSAASSWSALATPTPGSRCGSLPRGGRRSTPPPVCP